MERFADSLEHLLGELERIDLLVRGEVARFRHVAQADEQFRGLYISEQEVNALLQRPIGRPGWSAGEENAAGEFQATLDRLRKRNFRRQQASLRSGIELRLHRLSELFRLTPIEIDALLICMAVELDLRYERLYAYLQDDVTKKKPSVDLVLNLLIPTVEAKLQARTYFSSKAPLIRHRLLELIEDSSTPRPPLLAKYLKIDDRVAQYLLGSDELDARIRGFSTAVEPKEGTDDLLLDDALREGLTRLIHRHQRSGDRLIVHLQGPYGVGKQRLAESLCRELGIALLLVDLERVACDGETSCEGVLTVANREAQLQGAALYWKGVDALSGEQDKALSNAFISALEGRSDPTFLVGEKPWERTGSLRGQTLVTIELPSPSLEARTSAWSKALNGARRLDPVLDLAALASKFRLTTGQIQDAADTAQNLACWRDPEQGAITANDLHEACRLHSNPKLSTLARKITPTYGWGDIVLPADRVEQLREVCNSVKYRKQVYGEWGFDRKLAMGKGLSVLFAGPSGTGKTMAADIIAGELGLDLYKIDLSTVVSKYIGETEKNLSRIFTEAETSNAILFFDEADALFGKRSEVRDSHDRYANIETGYLLQRMEEYEGVVILATNLRKNMDDAFVRRLHFTVDFPFPDEADRRRIWEGIWPDETPCGRDLELDFIARRFQVSGGNIRNIALAAAFLAADDGGVIKMGHLMRATQREYQKMGKVVAEGEFGEYANLVSAQETREIRAKNRTALEG